MQGIGGIGTALKSRYPLKGNRMNRYDLLVFDMDGTIMDSKKFHTEVFYRFINKYVCSASYEEIINGLGATVKAIFDYFNVQEDQLEELMDKLDEYNSSQIDELAKEIPVAEGIAELLDEAKRHEIKTALLTNSMESVANKMLEVHDLDHRFDIVSGADYNSIDKKSRCRALEEMFSTKKILLFGDMEQDLILAKDMGYDACFVRQEMAWYKDLDYICNVLKPKYMITKMVEIIPYLQD